MWAFDVHCHFSYRLFLNHKAIISFNNHFFFIFLLSHFHTLPLNNKTVFSVCLLPVEILCMPRSSVYLCGGVKAFISSFGCKHRKSKGARPIQVSVYINMFLYTKVSFESEPLGLKTLSLGLICMSLNILNKIMSNRTLALIVPKLAF